MGSPQLGHDQVAESDRLRMIDALDNVSSPPFPQLYLSSSFELSGDLDDVVDGESASCFLSSALSTQAPVSYDLASLVSLSPVSQSPLVEEHSTAAAPQFIDVALQDLISTADSVVSRALDSSPLSVDPAAATPAFPKRPRSSTPVPSGSHASAVAAIDKLLEPEVRTTSGSSPQMAGAASEGSAISSGQQTSNPEPNTSAEDCSAAREPREADEMSPKRRSEIARESRHAAIARFRQKKKANKLNKKKLIRYDCRKVLAHQRPRVKGRFVRLEGDEKLRATK